VKELGEALKANDREALENEFADVIAWLASLANVTSVDLEKAALNKYNGKCPKCGHSPCQCSF
jgi:NTP pyrophosphatase (non-canonical NTP hydrolase)